jgi:hypothetical protein
MNEYKQVMRIIYHFTFKPMVLKPGANGIDYIQLSNVWPHYWREIFSRAIKSGDINAALNLALAYAGPLLSEQGGVHRDETC